MSIWVKVVVTVAVLAMMGTAGAYLLTRDSDTDTDGQTETERGVVGNAAEALAGGPPQLLYRFGTGLHVVTMEEDVSVLDEDLRGLVGHPSQGEEVARFEGEAVVAAPGSRWVAYVEETDEGPELHLVDPAMQEAEGEEAEGEDAATPGEDTTSEAEDIVVGPGISPLFDALGERLAYLRPVDPEDCDGSDCPGDVEIVVMEVGDPPGEAVVEAGRWEILTWVGARLLVADEDAAVDDEDPTTELVSLDGESVSLPLDPSLVSAGSPDGQWILLKSSPSDPAQFVRLEGDELVDDPIEVVTAEFEVIREVRWAHDSSQVVAVLQGELTSGVILFSPDNPDPELVEGTEQAQGSLMWAPSNNAFSFTRGALGALQAFFCRLGKDCSLLLEWNQGVTPLRMQ